MTTTNPENKFISDSKTFLAGKIPENKSIQSTDSDKASKLLAGFEDINKRSSELLDQKKYVTKQCEKKIAELDKELNELKKAAELLTQEAKQLKEGIDTSQEAKTNSSFPKLTAEVARKRTGFIAKLLRAPDMTSKDANLWEKDQKNFDDKIIRIAKLWVRFMEPDIKKGVKLSEIAESSYFSAKCEEINDNEFREIVSVLIKHWVYGSDLREWVGNKTNL